MTSDIKLGPLENLNHIWQMTMSSVVIGNRERGKGNRIFQSLARLPEKLFHMILKKDTICFTISDGLLRSMRRLWILISYLDHVLDPSPQGVFLDVILSVLVGRRTGPFTSSLLPLALLMRSAHTFSKLRTFLLVKVILILWTGASSSWTCFSLYAD